MTDVTPIFFDEDTDISVLRGAIAIIGYGNQGRAQAQNLRDSGMDVVVGNIRDDYWETAVSDGFEVLEIQEAVKRARFVMLLFLMRSSQASLKLRFFLH